MGTFDALEVGDRFDTPATTIDERTLKSLIELGGYTHPLFTDPAYAAASPLGGTPLPGEAVMLLMGGLVERSGRFDETVIALLGFREVRFRAPARAGVTLHVAVEVLEKRPKDARGILTMRWECVDGDGRTVAEALAEMLLEREAR